MSHKSDCAHDGTNASDARRQHADNKPRFQRLRTLIRPKPKRTPNKPKHIRTGSSDWGADEVGSFCIPDPEEYLRNWSNPSEYIDHKTGVIVNKPIPDDDSAIDDEECWKELKAVERIIREQRAVVGSGYDSGSDEEEWSGRWHRRLAKDEQRILRLRENLTRILGRRRSEEKERTEIGRGGDGDGGLLWDGVDDEKAGDADDERAEDSDGERGEDANDKEGGDADDDQGADSVDKEVADREDEEGANSTDEEGGGGSTGTYMTAPMEANSAEQLLQVDVERPSQSNSNSQRTTPLNDTPGRSSKARQGANEVQKLFRKLAARVKKWRQYAKDRVPRHVVQM